MGSIHLQHLLLQVIKEKHDYKKIYCPTCLIDKFGYFLLWTIANTITPQKWKKKPKCGHIDIIKDNLKKY